VSDEPQQHEVYRVAEQKLEERTVSKYPLEHEGEGSQ
jgi:hypothetical protein